MAKTIIYTKGKALRVVRGRSRRITHEARILVGGREIGRDDVVAAIRRELAKERRG